MEGVNRARFRLKGKTNMDPKRIGFHSHPDLNSEAGTSALSQISHRTPSVTHPSVKTPMQKRFIEVATRWMSRSVKRKTDPPLAASELMSRVTSAASKKTSAGLLLLCLRFTYHRTANQYHVIITSPEMIAARGSLRDATGTA